MVEIFDLGLFHKSVAFDSFLIFANFKFSSLPLMQHPGLGGSCLVYMYKNQKQNSRFTLAYNYKNIKSLQIYYNCPSALVPYYGIDLSWISNTVPFRISFFFFSDGQLRANKESLDYCFRH